MSTQTRQPDSTPRLEGSRQPDDLGGVILAMILIAGLVLWCRFSRKES